MVLKCSHEEVEVDNMKKKCNWVIGRRHAWSKGSSWNRSLNLEDRETFLKFNELRPFRLCVLNKCSPVVWWPQKSKKINANKDYYNKIYFVVMVVEKHIYNKSWSLEGLIFQKIIMKE